MLKPRSLSTSAFPFLSSFLQPFLGNPLCLGTLGRAKARKFRKGLPRKGCKGQETQRNLKKSGSLYLTTTCFTRLPGLNETKVVGRPYKGKGGSCLLCLGTLGRAKETKGSLPIVLFKRDTSYTRLVTLRTNCFLEPKGLDLIPFSL